IQSAGDLLMHFPFRHERFEPRLIRHLEPDECVTVIGRLSRIRMQGYGRGSSVRARITDNTGHCIVRWFNAGYIADRIEAGGVVCLGGGGGGLGGSPQAVNRGAGILGEKRGAGEGKGGPRIEPVFNGAGGFSAAVVGGLMAPQLDRLAALGGELYPPAFLKQR